MLQINFRSLKIRLVTSFSKLTIYGLSTSPLGIWPSGVRENFPPFGRGSNPLYPPQTVCACV